MWHVGIDLHRRTVVIAAVDDYGRTINPVTLGCRETSAIVEHLRSLRPFRAVIEATASCRWLYDLLATEGTILLAHPAKKLFQNPVSFLAQMRQAASSWSAWSMRWVRSQQKFESAEVAEPSERSFNDVARTAQAAVVREDRSVLAASPQLGGDATATRCGEDLCRFVAGVALQQRGLTARPTAGTLNRRHGIEQRLDALFVALVGRARSRRPAFLPRSVGFGPVCAPLKARGSRRCRH